MPPFPRWAPTTEPTPPGIDLVVTTGSLREAPFTDVHKLRTVHKYELWEVNGAPGSATAIDQDPGQPTNCNLGLEDG